MKKYLKLIRVKHYIKNGLIFLPLFFSQSFLKFNLLRNVLLSFLSFSFMCSVVYIINDLNDIEKDRKHPIKKKRPLASGEISKKEAIFIMIVLFVLSILINVLISTNNYYSLLLLLGYLVLNILYSCGLKNIVLLDIAILVSGFLIRILYGSSVADISISNWLYLTVMSMAFYLGLGKRKKELEKNSDVSRKVLSKYNHEFLDKNMYLCMTLTIVFYALWTIDPSIATIHSGMVWTVPIVLLICMKYSLDVEGSSFGDPVDVVTKDKILLSMVFIYILIMTWIFYGSELFKVFC
ncbi:MAG: UbiA prenyltransferase family protein [Bacilli bacterium]|nr:UbiA prenyltransferase family protein [Bacilli bacterium]